MTTLTATNLLATEPTKEVKLGQSRSVTYTWVGADTDASTFEVRLSVFHRKDRKVFGASVNKVEVEKTDGPFRVEKFLPFDAVRLPSIPAGARFSEKALLAAGETALAQLRLLADTPAVKEVVAKAVEGTVE